MSQGCRGVQRPGPEEQEKNADQTTGLFPPSLVQPLSSDRRQLQMVCLITPPPTVAATSSPIGLSGPTRPLNPQCPQVKHPVWRPVPTHDRLSFASSGRGYGEGNANLAGSTGASRRGPEADSASATTARCGARIADSTCVSPLPPAPPPLTAAPH